MTKLLEDIIAKAAALSPEEQDAVAIQMLEAMASLDDDAPVPEWHKEILRQREAEMKAFPDDFITLEALKEEFKESETCVVLKVIVRSAVRTAIEEARAFHEQVREGLGEQLVAALFETLDDISATPSAFPIRFERYRRARTKPFNYLVYYLVEPDRVVIVAIIHASRDPQEFHRQIRRDL